MREKNMEPGPQTNLVSLETQIYKMIGEEGFAKLVAAFYSQIPADDILGPLYPKDDLAGAQDRLRLFLIQRFGGPEHYSQQRGHPRLRMRHAPFPVNRAAVDRWLAVMDRAMKQTNLPAAVDMVLRRYFDDTAKFLMNSKS